MPASRMKLGLPDAAPATPMTSDRLLTRPSLTPKMTARSVPERPPARCQVSRRPTSAALVAPRAMATPSRPGWLTSGICSPAFSLSQMTACSRSSAAIAATSGETPWPSYSASSSPSSALTSSATADVPATRAARMMNRTRIRGPAGGGTSAPSSRSFDAQMSAWRRSLPAMRRNASARRGSFSMRGERVVQDDRVAFQLEVVETLLDVDGGHVVIVGHRLRVDSGRCPRPTDRPSATSPPPDVARRDARPRRAPGAGRTDAHRPRRRCRTAAEDRRPSRGPTGSFAHAMPASLRGPDDSARTTCSG